MSIHSPTYVILGHLNKYDAVEAFRHQNDIISAHLFQSSDIKKNSKVRKKNSFRTALSRLVYSQYSKKK